METFLKKINTGIVVLLAFLTLMMAINIAEILLYTPLKVKVMNISVVDSRGNMINDKLPLDRPVLANVEQSVVASFLVVRNYTGFNNVERILEITSTDVDTKSEIVLNYQKRPSLPSSNVVIAQYDIPNYLKPGCGYHLYSRNSIEYSYNIIQRLLGTVVDGPKIKLCIIGE